AITLTLCNTPSSFAVTLRCGVSQAVALYETVRCYLHFGARRRSDDVTRYGLALRGACGKPARSLKAPEPRGQRSAEFEATPEMLEAFAAA
ncbi:uncharacterized, partial [Tachysurus ichikawai]